MEWLVPGQGQSPRRGASVSASSGRDCLATAEQWLAVPFYRTTSDDSGRLTPAAPGRETSRCGPSCHPYHGDTIICCRDMPDVPGTCSWTCVGMEVREQPCCHSSVAAYLFFEEVGDQSPSFALPNHSIAFRSTKARMVERDVRHPTS